tara:strand:+ start:11790 stop:12773 length:984 start_codon:yes stop_codon:yes gene_type:complete
MGFLDNSGDIILDAVLTDAGRKRLARGDGTFKVTKYAFGDDEIDYGKYDSTNASGSAYYDLEILQTPILEAFTNNRSSLKSRLISLTNNNLLFLPELKLNQVQDIAKLPTNKALGSGSFYITVDTTAVQQLTDVGSGARALDGTVALNTSPNAIIRVDQGLNTTKISADANLSPELTEQQYMIEMDNRLGQLVDIGFAEGSTSTGLAAPAFVDDDQIATYYLTQNVGGYIQTSAPGALVANGTDPGAQNAPNWESIDGPRGTKLGFSIFAKDALRQSDYLFNTIGETKSDPFGDGNNYLIISSTIRVYGVTTGYRIDIPVIYVKSTT